MGNLYLIPFVNSIPEEKKISQILKNSKFSDFAAFFQSVFPLLLQKYKTVIKLNINATLNSHMQKFDKVV